MPTPHNSAKKGDFAKTVLMPGDPLRAKFIAENFLTDAVLVNNVRGVQGYTGYFKGKRVSVMASGMGIPSIAIYARELYEHFDVQSIIRVGSAGGLANGIKTKDVIIALGACTDSNFANQYRLNGTFAPIADFFLAEKAFRLAKQANLPVRIGNILSSDVFYSDRTEHEKWRDMGVLAVEMECAGLYTVASTLNKKALCICTVSDCPLTGESLSSDERQTGFGQMIELALAVAEE